MDKSSNNFEIVCLSTIIIYYLVFSLVNAENMEIPSNDFIKSTPNVVHKAVCAVTVDDVTATAKAEAITPLTNNEKLSSIEDLKYQIIYMQNFLQNELAEIKNFFKMCQCSSGFHHINNGDNENDASPNKSFTTLSLNMNNTLLKTTNSFNHTEISDGEGNSLLYVYRWKLKEFNKYLHNNSAELQSDIFSIAGRGFKIKIYIHYLQRECLFIQLIENPFSKDSSPSNFITLETNGSSRTKYGKTVFKEITNDRNVSKEFKYTISILNQNTIGQTNLVSQLFHTFESGFYIPISALIGNLYIHEDAIVVQVNFYI